MELEKAVIALNLFIIAFITLVSTISSKNYDGSSFHDAIKILTSIKEVIRK